MFGATRPAARRSPTATAGGRAMASRAEGRRRPPAHVSIPAFADFRALDVPASRLGSGNTCCLPEGHHAHWGISATESSHLAAGSLVVLELKPYGRTRPVGAEPVGGGIDETPSATVFDPCPTLADFPQPA